MMQSSLNKFLADWFNNSNSTLMTKESQQIQLRVNGFSLIEVVLSMGIFLVTVLALVGLLGPALSSVSNVKKTDEVASIVDSVNGFLQSSTRINTNGSRFDAIYNAVQTGHYATILAFRAREGSTTVFNIGFVGETQALITKDDIYLPEGDTNIFRAIGTIYRVVLTPSSAVPLNYHHATETKTIDEIEVTVPKRHVATGIGGTDTSTNTYRLKNAFSNVNSYDENVFAMEVRIFAEDLNPDRNNFDLNVDLNDLNDNQLVFTYDTAILRD